jgi:hypothetical protein
METVGTNPFGEPINQPLQWETRLEKTGILGLVDLPHFGRGQYATACVKQLLAVTHGRGHLVGQAHLNRCRDYREHNRISISGHGSRVVFG